MRDVHQGILYVGNAFAARDLRLLYDRQIAAVVDLAANEKPAQLGRDLLYFRIPMVDGGNFDCTTELAIDVCLALLQRRVKTLVSCSAGMSRSPTVAAAAIALLSGSPLADCLSAIVRDAPRDVSPLLLDSVQAAMQRKRGLLSSSLHNQ